MKCALAEYSEFGVAVVAYLKTWIPIYSPSPSYEIPIVEM
jgi:hypothetical protein